MDETTPASAAAAGTESADRVTEAATRTRNRMMEVAEQLFAEHGLAAVSLRMVGQHAGQKNNSAGQYHFGSKQGLVTAIIALRAAPIEARRGELLGRLRSRSAGGPPDVRSLVEVLVHPLAESAMSEQPRPHYLRFLANATDDFSLTAVWQVDRVQPPSYQAAVRQLRELLPELSTAAFERRMRWLARISLRLLADQEQAIAEQGEAAEPMSHVLADVVEMMVALLEAPPSPPAADPPPADAGRSTGG